MGNPIFVELEYIDAEGAMVRATRKDGSIIIIEPINRDLWELITGGEHSIAAYAPPIKPSEAQILVSERAEMYCSRMQMRLAMHGASILETVDTLFNEGALGIRWREAGGYNRGSIIIAEIAEGLTLSDAEIDDLFRVAMAITD